MFNLPDTPEKDYSSKLIMTTTNELYMPTRLYYKIHNKKLLLKSLKKLKCIEFEEDSEDHFIVSYYKEAKNIGLGTHYQDVPEELYPIMLAEGYIKPGNILHLDLKSLLRGIEILHFISEHISHNIVEIKAFAHANYVTTCNSKDDANRVFKRDFGELFDNLPSNNPTKEIDEYMQKLKSEYAVKDEFDDSDIPEEKLAILDNFFAEEEQRERENYPKAERLDIKYKRSEHGELLDMLEFRASIKEHVAIKRYEGHEDYTSFDATNEFLNFMKSKTEEMQDVN